MYGDTYTSLMVIQYIHANLDLLTLWRPLLPYGYSYKASWARPLRICLRNMISIGAVLVQRIRGTGITLYVLYKFTITTYLLTYFLTGNLQEFATNSPHTCAYKTYKCNKVQPTVFVLRLAPSRNLSSPKILQKFLRRLLISVGLLSNR